MELGTAPHRRSRHAAVSVSPRDRYLLGRVLPRPVQRGDYSLSKPAVHSWRIRARRLRHLPCAEWLPHCDLRLEAAVVEISGRSSPRRYHRYAGAHGAHLLPDVRSRPGTLPYLWLRFAPARTG